MREETYKRTPFRVFEGRKVITLENMRNGYVHIPEGTIMTITWKGGGLTLTGNPCDHCGIKPSIGKVHPSRVDLLSDLTHSKAGVQDCPAAEARRGEDGTPLAGLVVTCPLCLKRIRDHSSREDT